MGGSHTIKVTLLCQEVFNIIGILYLYCIPVVGDITVVLQNTKGGPEVPKLVGQVRSGSVYPGNPKLRMVVKEETSLLPSSAKSSTRSSKGNASIKNIFQWLQIATTVVMLVWLVMLSMRTRQPVLSKDFVNELIKSHEVRYA